ncbi:MAG: penicillin-binding protein 2 [Gammaproteobacteria bacterium]|nr:penicillin-binding protein 2 [Gammaproteobacteria bacterium]NND53922.1 penicillin-binding protein 2 [Gammaproteobacteria bacterium]
MRNAANQIKDHWREKRIFTARIVACGVIAVALTGVVTARLINLQLINADYYAAQSQGNHIRVQPLPPTRGLIYDRHGRVLAENTPSYQLELTPEQVPDLADTLERLTAQGLLNPENRARVQELISSRRRFDSIPIRQKMTDEEVARFAVLRPAFPGVEIRARLARTYPFGSVAAHALGYMGGISAGEQQSLDPAAYAGTSYIGKVATEKSYEGELHGTVGHQDVLVNVHGRVMQVLDTELSRPGRDLILSLDIDTQIAAEEALGDRRGAVVAIDPRNGELLALASTPSFDPNAFIDGMSRDEFRDLQNDRDQPLFNRALRGKYPPGSTIKPIIALAGLEQNAIDARRKWFCKGHFSLPGSTHRYRDWKPAGHGMVDLNDAIAQSCDTYFYDLANNIGIDIMAATLSQFGLGDRTGLDVGPESSGLVPNRSWKRRNFADAEDQIWYPGETVIAGIGQGFLLTTPLQLAHATAAIAMRGTRYRPALVRGLRDPASGDIAVRQPRKLQPVTVSAADRWDEIIKAMEAVMYDPKGTGIALGLQSPYRLAGKSGTAQVISIAQNEEYNEEEIAERRRDHALFVAFAPTDDPRIAVAVIVENGGSGSGVAGPVASQVITTHLSNEAQRLTVVAGAAGNAF